VCWAAASRELEPTPVTALVLLQRGGVMGVVGLLLLAAAAISVTPADFSAFCDHICRFYAELSEEPFNFAVPNRHQFRILTPLLAHILHLRGAPYFSALPLIMIWFFLAAIYGFFRYKHRYSLFEAVGMASLMAFSIPVWFSLIFPGFVDATSYLLLFLCIAFIEYIWLWPLFYGFALFNHEHGLFAAPWLLTLATFRWRFSLSGFGWSLALIGLAVLLLLLFRDFVLSQGARVSLTAEFYLKEPTLLKVFRYNHGRYLLAAFSAFKLFWFWPLAVIYFAARGKGRKSVAVWLLLVMGSATAQLLLAWDQSRLMGFAFPAILLGAHEMRRMWGSKVFQKRLWLIIAANALVPNVFLVLSKTLAIWNLPASLIYLFVFGDNLWSHWYKN
jgi:hypothetical protein